MHRFHLRNVMCGFKRAAWRFRFRQTSSAASLKSQLPASSSPILGEYGQHHPHSQAALTIDSGSVSEIGPAAPKLVKALLAVPRLCQGTFPILSPVNSILKRCHLEETSGRILFTLLFYFAFCSVLLPLQAHPFGKFSLLLRRRQEHKPSRRRRLSIPGLKAQSL